jgi:hypothetical protein
MGWWSERVVAAVEPSNVAWRLASRRVAGLPVPVRRAGLDGQRLAADDGEFDAVLSTFPLCTIPGRSPTGWPSSSS